MMTVKPARKNLSGSLEDYLETIWFLQRDNRRAHTKDIADELGVKMPSVTAALHALQELGYIEYDRKNGPRLTEDGACIAQQVASRHELLKSFFTEVLLMNPDNAEPLACSIEHLIGADASRRLANLTTYLKENCFHCGKFSYVSYQAQLDQPNENLPNSCSDEEN